MLTKLSKMVAIAIVFGPLLFIPNVKGTPMVGQGVGQHKYIFDRT